MTQEDKDTLLKYLCMALPYGVKCHFKYGSAEDDITLSCIDNNVARFKYGWYGTFHVSIDADYIKPYLRPMSSMTNEEKEELVDFGLAYWSNGKHTDEDGNTIVYGGKEFQLLPDIETYDWLNKRHFDYRGLIDKGLAIEVTEENNPYKN